MQIKYFQTVWNDVTHSEGWFKKAMLLALVAFIPIFGVIVVAGYAYGWAREIAWNMRTSMPKHIFGNEDGKLYRRGFFVLVISFVFSLIPFIVQLIGDAISGAGVFSASSLSGAHGAAAVGISSGALAFAAVLYLISMLLSLFLMVFAWVGCMRSTIYDNLGAGFQIGKIWSMMKYDSTGILKIFGMNLLTSLVVGAIAFVVIFFLIFIFAFAVVLGGGGYIAGGTYMNGDILGASLGLGIVGVILLLAAIYFLVVFAVIVELLTVRALGYWTWQFDVAHWRGKNDPMPFELASVPPNTYAAYQQQAYQQYYQNQQGQPMYQQPMQQYGQQAQPMQYPQNQVMQQPQNKAAQQPQAAQQPVSQNESIQPETSVPENQAGAGASQTPTTPPADQPTETIAPAAQDSASSDALPAWAKNLPQDQKDALRNKHNN